jgi:hypothetical protein
LGDETIEPFLIAYFDISALGHICWFILFIIIIPENKNSGISHALSNTDF